MLDQVNVKMTKQVGWISLIIGFIILTAFGAYAFFTDFEVESGGQDCFGPESSHSSLL